MHNDCTEDMINAAMDAINEAKALCIDDPKVLSNLGTDVASFIGKYKITDPNKISEIAQSAAESINTKVYKGVEIVGNPTKPPLGEFDTVDIPGKRFIEDKSALGLSNPLNQLTPEDWATKQIVNKTRVRINSLPDTLTVRPSQFSNGVVPEFNEFKDFKDFVFKIDADTPDLRNAVSNAINTLKAEFPDYNFSSIFGQ